MSSNRKAINYKLVGTGLALQVFFAFFVLKLEFGQMLFAKLGRGVTRLLDYSDRGAEFVFGVLVNKQVMDSTFGGGNSFIFFFKIIPTIIFVAVLVSLLYHLGIMQRVVMFFAKVMHRLMGVSGSEALSNAASGFVGQVEAQIMIKPYLNGMTQSELLASMAGSMACIAGGVMAIYIKLGVPAEYLLAANIMAAPGALVISKIILPETEKSETQGQVKVEVKKTSSNLIDAVSHGASDGLRISLNVVAMLIGFIALIAMLDGVLGWAGGLLASAGADWSGIGINLATLSLKDLLGLVFSLFAYAMGVPWADVKAAGALMGTKLVVNEFVAYLDLVSIQKTLAPKTNIIVAFALCGFANFSSIAIQVGGIGELAPGRRHDLAKLGFRALVAGTLASYLSATIAGMIMS